MAKKKNEEEKEKQRVNLLVNTEILRQWDEFATSIGCDRTSLIHNAIAVYKLFITNQLNGDKTESIKEQIEQLRFLIEGLHQRERFLEKKEEDIDAEFKSLDTSEIKDFEIVSKNILDLLESWGSLVEDTIKTHLKYPGWLVWTVLKKLKAMKKVKVVGGEWSLYE